MHIVPCTNFTSPISGRKIRCVVIHYTASSLQSTISWFQNPNSKVSAHVVIDRDGEVYQLVPEGMIAWHAGKSTWRDYVNINPISYGIEMVTEAKYQFDFTEEQYKALVDLLWSEHGIGDKWCLSDKPVGFPNADILGHQHVAPGRKFDPGPRFNWDKIVRPVVHKPVVKPVIVENKLQNDAGGSQDDAGLIASKPPIQPFKRLLQLILRHPVTWWLQKRSS